MVSYTTRPTASTLCVLSIIIILCANIGDAANRYAGNRHRRDIIESSASNEQPSPIDENIGQNDGILTADTDSADETVIAAKDVIEHENKINSIGTKENESTTANVANTSTDANNAIEQEFDAKQSHGPVLVVKNDTAEVIPIHSTIVKGRELSHDKPDVRDNR